MKRSRIDSMIMYQEALPVLTRESLDALMLGKLNALLKREKERGGFYSRLPENLSYLSELRSLPFTTDEDLAHHAGGLLLCSQSDILRVLSDATSGTTGAAKRVFYTEGDCRRTVELFKAGLGELIFPGSVTMICMPFSGEYGLGELIAAAVAQLGAVPLRIGAGRSFGELRDIIAREKPDTYVGMPTELLSLLRFCGRGSLRRALVSGDACPESVIKDCEKLIGSRLFPHYGSREMALGGAVCCEAHEGMHLRENHVIAEIVDENGAVLPDGEYGELVITTIGMEALPLIRYRTGDYTRILPHPCPCGSVVKRLDRVVRRGEAGKMAELDEKLFSCGTLIDYRAYYRGGGIAIEGITSAYTDKTALMRLCPELSEINLRPVRDTDSSFYRGKRIMATPHNTPAASALAALCGTAIINFK